MSSYASAAATCAASKASDADLDDDDDDDDDDFAKRRGKRSSSRSGRHRPCDRAPPSPSIAAWTSAQKCARSSIRLSRAFSSTAARTCGGSFVFPGRRTCPPFPPKRA
eukprot:30180-Pelagococcus_subviridis.AAC.1